MIGTNEVAGHKLQVGSNQGEQLFIFGVGSVCVCVCVYFSNTIAPLEADWI